MSTVTWLPAHGAAVTPVSGSVNDWRAACPCDWRGPRRRTSVVAQADAHLHALEASYGEPVVTP